MDGATLKVGDIVMARIPDPEGASCADPHPAMVVRSPDASGEMWVVGISTKFTVPPERLTLELPWNPDGHPQTGL